MNDFVTPPVVEEEDDSQAKQLYDMGKQLCEMAEAMGYSGEEEEEAGEDEEMEAPVKKSKVDTAMSFFGKE